LDVKRGGCLREGGERLCEVREEERKNLKYKKIKKRLINKIK